MGPLALLPLLLLAQTHSRWEASVQTEVRARTPTAQDNGSGGLGAVPSGVSGDADIRPRLSGGVFNGHWTLSGSYSPTFRTREPYITDRAGRPWGDHSHILQAQAAWAKEGTARVFIGEYFNYGTLDLSTLNSSSIGPTPTVPVPPVRSGLGLVQELTTDTNGGVELTLSPRHTLLTTAGFLYGGGADEFSRRSLPLQSSIRAASKLSWLASRLDTVSGLLGVQYVRFYQVPATATQVAYPGARIVIAELAAGYARLLAEQTHVDITVGVTGAFGEVPNTDPLDPAAFRQVTGVAPLVAAGLSHRIGYRTHRFDLRANASYAPFVDRYAGSVYQRVEGGGAVTWSNVNHFSAALSAGVARSIPVGNEAALTNVYAEASAGYQGDPWWRVDLIGRLAWVNQGASVTTPPTITTSSETQWVVGLSLTLIAASEQPRTFY